jgi:hypothetical protein
MKVEEGYVKFKCIWEKTDFDFPEPLFEKLNCWRDRLYQNKLIGSHDNGTGFGNISTRLSDNSFIITGTATGSKKKLTKNDYALVTDYDLLKNMVKCSGKIMASAESLSHAAIYDKNTEFTGVIHIHHFNMWEKLRGNLPTTNYNVEYGTPEMAFEVKNLFDRTNVRQTRIFVMGGHKEGIVSFGRDLDEAGQVILEYFSPHRYLSE